jgi:cytoskeleton protein RodZ
LKSGTQEPADEAPRDKTVGASLAQARQALGLTLDDVANQLKFSTRQIEALESGRYEQLPGGPFVRGMIRSYARLVDLDPGPLLADIGGARAAEDASRIAARFKQPVPFSDASKRSTMTYVVLAVGVLLVAVAVVVQWRQERAPAPKPAATRPALKAPVEVHPPREELPPRAAQSVEPAPPVALNPPAPVLGGAPAQRIEPSAPSVGRQRVGVRVDEESWVEVKDAAGTTLISQLMPAGSGRTVEGEAPLSVVIGNAHHVQLTHNGKPVDLKPHIKVEVARLTLK